MSSIASEWNHLLHRSRVDEFFLTAQWHELWWSCFPDEAAPRLVGVWRDGRLIGIAPFAQWGDRIGFAGGEETADFLDVIAATDAEHDVWDAILDWLAATPNWNLVELRNVRENSPTRTVLPALAARRGLVYAEEVEDVSPLLVLPKDWDTYLAGLSKKDRHELRRKLRRLEAAGDVKWYTIPSDAPPDVVTRAIDDFIRLHRLSDESKAAFMTSQMASYFAQIVRRFLPTGELRLYFLEIDGVRAATAIIFDYRGGFFLYNSGYDPSMSRLAVGLLLKAYCIADAIEAGRTVFDFLQGNEPYKYDLGAVAVPIFRITLRREG